MHDLLNNHKLYFNKFLQFIIISLHDIIKGIWIKYIMEIDQGRKEISKINASKEVLETWTFIHNMIGINLETSQTALIFVF